MNRRTFLQHSALTAAATFTASHAAKGPAACGLGISTYGLQSMDLESAIKLVAETGYDCVEITAFEGFTGDPLLVSKERRAGIQKQMADQKLRLCALMADLHPNAEKAVHAKQTDSLKRMAELGHDVAPAQPLLIQTVLAGKDWETSKMLFRDRLADWVKAADEMNFTLVIKPHRMQAMSRPEDAIWLFKQLGEPPRLRMIYDYSHFHHREPVMTIASTVAQSLPWTVYVASKDVLMKDGKAVFALTGEGGEFDHAEIIKAFVAGGYTGDFCCEVSSQIWKAKGYDAVAATKTCYKNLAAAIQRAGVVQRR
ncbi:MAG: sugar phosphate isomerase/epimerase [Verrucomicrobiaceae bacterium]|nr:sugar phosphate isomerase/epimerase [Verrucomicrobiaceae bacterium]